VLAFLLLLVIVYIIVGIIGWVVHGLFWLFVIVAVLFVGTVFFGGNHFGKSRSKR